VQIAKYLGAYVIATSRTVKHEWLRGLGADEVVDYTTTRFEHVVNDVDVVVDLVGDEVDGTTSRSLTVLAPGGLLVPVPGSVPPELAEAAARGRIRVRPFLVEPDGAALAQIATLIDKGHIRVEVADVLPLEQAAEAHRRLATGRTQGKIVLRVARGVRRSGSTLG
jgi:NADPH:quinone reductase-like Zn-dependent oxidoreductase